VKADLILQTEAETDLFHQTEMKADLILQTEVETDLFHLTEMKADLFHQTGMMVVDQDLNQLADARGFL
jgi:hypothetical protein